MRIGAEKLIFWGAGATASIGLRGTRDQGISVKNLVEDHANQNLVDRVSAALKDSNAWVNPLSDLLLILGDDTDDIYQISRPACEAMSRHWRDQSSQALDARIHELRALYDWPALKALVRISPGFKSKDSERYQLQDIFNLIDLHAHNFHGFPGIEGFLHPGRLIAARRALQMILNTFFYIDWQAALSTPHKKSELEKHLEFARLMTEYHQDEGLRLAVNYQHFDSREFYLGSISFASLNYDTVALWAQFIANRDANLNPPYIGFPQVPLKIFHDFGIFMAVSTIDSKKNEATETKERVWYPLNEASAQRLNDRDHNSRRVRINKFLFPHGCLCWRECPSCGKLSAYMGKEWDFFSPALIPPPPLRGFTDLADIMIAHETDEERNAWDCGAVDARACVHCGELSFAQHTQAVMQSNFKTQPPSFIEEVQRDLRVATQAAKHIILMGYSLPPDDVTYRAFFAARQQRRQKDDQPLVRCSVVVGRDWGDCWHGSDEINKLLPFMEKGEPPRTTLEAARDLFGDANVRFYGGGIPRVFCDGDIVSPHRFQQLIDWNSTK